MISEKNYNIIIRGGDIPNGTVAVSGAKNSATRLMAAALLTDEKVVLYNFPTKIEDALNKADFLKQSGVEIIIHDEESKIEICSKNFANIVVRTPRSCFDYIRSGNFLMMPRRCYRAGTAPAGNAGRTSALGLSIAREHRQKQEISYLCGRDVNQGLMAKTWVFFNFKKQ